MQIDRPKGSVHPRYPDMVYPLHYGLVPGTKAADGDEIDVYLLDDCDPSQVIEAVVIAIVHRADDVEDKLVAAQTAEGWTESKVAELVQFQEQHFDSTIRMS